MDIKSFIKLSITNKIDSLLIIIYWSNPAAWPKVEGIVQNLFKHQQAGGIHGLSGKFDVGFTHPFNKEMFILNLPEEFWAIPTSLSPDPGGEKFSLGVFVHT